MSGDSSNVAQIRVTSSNREPRRGSGYRVNGELVLTAAHVVEDSDHVLLTFDADLPTQWTVNADVAVCFGDLALLRMQTPQVALRTQEKARFGRVGTRVATVKFETLGFPAWQLRPDRDGVTGGRYRDAAQVSGSFPTRSSWRDGMLELLVDRPPAEMDLEGDPRLEGIESEWDGMSGAAVWAEGRIIGVLSMHRRSEGLGHLQATRLDDIYRGTDQSAELFRSLLDLPANIDALTDVIPVPYAERLAFEFASDIREVAPSALFDRESELEDLRAFCLREEYYIWIQASAWSGKTALSSWLALNPPKQVEVVAFFVVRRQIGRADVNAFLDSAIAQLSTYATEREVALANVEEKRRKFGALLEQAAAQAAADGRRLTLLVDGLDEDVSHGLNLPSIASVLPARPIRGLNVIVTGRPTPLPFDVPGSHPLRMCRRYELEASPHAKAIEIAARQELEGMLRSDDVTSIEILAFLTVSGGGLTSLELQSLIGVASLHDVKRRLEGSLARSLAVHSGYRGQSIFVFGHGTLADTAKLHFLDEEQFYLSRLHTWASKHIRSGWSESTPQFLLTRYFLLLKTIDAANLPPMIELATSPERHDVMLARTNGDWDGLAEVEFTLGATKSANFTWLPDIARLSIERGRLIERSSALPLQAGPLWARMGDSARARRAADLITRREEQAPYLARISSALADTGDLVGAKEVADTIPDFRGRLQCLSNIAVKFAQRLDYKNSAEIAEFLEASAREFPDRGVRATFLTHAAACYSLMGDGAYAEELGAEIESLTAEINRPKSPYKGSVAIAARLATIGQTDRGWKIAGQISEPYWHFEAKNAVAAYLPDSENAIVPSTGEGDYAAYLRWSAVGLMRTAVRLRPSDPELASQLLSRALETRPLASMSADVVEPTIDQAVLDVFSNGLRLSNTAKPADKVKLLCHISDVLSQEGKLDEAKIYAEKAGTEIDNLSTGLEQCLHTINVAEAYLAAGVPMRARELLNRAETIARQTIIRSSSKHWKTIAVALAATGRADSAEAIIGKIYPDEVQADEARLQVIQALMGAGHCQTALAVTRTITADVSKLRGLLDVAADLSSDQKNLRQVVLIAAYDLASANHETTKDLPVMTSLVEQMARTGWLDKAEKIASARQLADERSASFRAISRAAAYSGDFDEALRFTAMAYLENHRSKSAGVDTSAAVAISKSLDESDLKSALNSFHQLQDARLRVISARWILKSGKGLTGKEREYFLSAAGGALKYVNGLGRALLHAGSFDRLTDVLDLPLLQGETEAYRHALVETFEAAVSTGHDRLILEVLATKTWPDGSLIFGYCLAAAGNFGDAWNVLRANRRPSPTALEQRLADVVFLDSSSHHNALLSILRNPGIDDSSALFLRLVPHLRLSGVSKMIEALSAHLSQELDTARQMTAIKAVLGEISSAPAKVDCLWQSIKTLEGKSAPELVAQLVVMALEVADSTLDSVQATILSEIPEAALNSANGRQLVALRCKKVLSGPHWPLALRALAGIDSEGLHQIAKDLVDRCPTVTTVG